MSTIGQAANDDDDSFSNLCKTPKRNIFAGAETEVAMIIKRSARG